MTPTAVSVVVPVYNGADYIGKTADSILDQQYSDFELLLVNDGSSDDSAQLLDELASRDSRIRVFHKANGGVACARNFGIRQARGELVAFCDQDDLWHPQKLRRQVPLFDDPQVGLVYCGAAIEHTDAGKIHRPGLANKPRGEIFDTLIRQNQITCCSAIARKSEIEACGGFDDDRRLMGVDDWHLWLKLALRCRADYVNDHLCTHVFHGDNYSLNDDKMHEAEIVCLDKIAPLAAQSGRTPDWDAIKQQIHLRYAQSYVYGGHFRLAADSFLQAHRQSSCPPALLKSLFYRVFPGSWLHYLQAQKRRLAR